MNLLDSRMIDGSDLPTDPEATVIGVSEDGSLAKTAIDLSEYTTVPQVEAMIEAAVSKGIVSGGVFTPTPSNEYPTPATGNDYVYMLSCTGGTYTFTGGSLAGQTASTGWTMFYHADSASWTLIEFGTSSGGGGGIVSVNGKTPDSAGNVVLTAAELDAVSYVAGTQDVQIEGGLYVRQLTTCAGGVATPAIVVGNSVSSPFVTMQTNPTTKDFETKSDITVGATSFDWNFYNGSTLYKSPLSIIPSTVMVNGSLRINGEEPYTPSNPPPSSGGGGGVSSVCGVSPDASGNVAISYENVGAMAQNTGTLYTFAGLVGARSFAIHESADDKPSWFERKVMYGVKGTYSGTSKSGALFTVNQDGQVALGFSDSEGAVTWVKPYTDRVKPTASEVGAVVQSTEVDTSFYAIPVGSRTFTVSGSAYDKPSWFGDSTMYGVKGTYSETSKSGALFTVNTGGQVALGYSDSLSRMSWVRPYTDKNKPTPAELGVVPTTDVATTISWSGLINKIPKIGSTGILEIARYIDFHTTDSTADYDVRLDCSESGLLKVVDGSLEVGGSVLGEGPLVSTREENIGSAKLLPSITEGEYLVGGSKKDKTGLTVESYLRIGDDNVFTFVTSGEGAGTYPVYHAGNPPPATLSGQAELEALRAEVAELKSMVNQLMNKEG